MNEKEGLGAPKVNFNLVLIVKGYFEDLDKLVKELQMKGEILLVYKRVSTNRFTIREERN